RDKVSGSAAVAVLPAYCELPPAQQNAFLASWDKLENKPEIIEKAGFNEDDPLADHGILSLIVRTHVRNNLRLPGEGILARLNPYAAASSLQGFVAYWEPWMWKWGGVNRPNFFYYLTGLLV